MNSLIIYDHEHHETEKIATTIASSLSSHGNARIVKVREAEQRDIELVDLLLIGSPTAGGNPTHAIQDFILRVRPKYLEDITVGAFDTRFSVNSHSLDFRMLMKNIGYAAPYITEMIRLKGAKIVAEPEGFLVNPGESRLEEGELDRAASWASDLISAGSLQWQSMPQ